MLLGGEFLINQAALRFADALDDHLFGCLCCNTPEFLRLNRDANRVANLGALCDLFRSIYLDFMRRIRNLFHGKLVHMHFDLLFVFIEDDFHIILTFRVVTPECGKHGLPDLFIHVFPGNTFFLLNVFNRFKKFCVHFFCHLPFSLKRNMKLYKSYILLFKPDLLLSGRKCNRTIFILF